MNSPKFQKLGAIILILALVLTALAGAISAAPPSASAQGLSAISAITAVDTDLDGIENNLDPDIDGDGVVNAEDEDIDGDGLTNFDDPDPAGTNGVDTQNPNQPGERTDEDSGFVDIFDVENNQNSAIFWSVTGVILVAVFGTVFAIWYRRRTSKK